jgi:hypothetical protein
MEQDMYYGRKYWPQSSNTRKDDQGIHLDHIAKNIYTSADLSYLHIM